MGLLSNMFGKKQLPAPQYPEHAVIVRFTQGQSNVQPISELEEKLMEIISTAGVGEYDGNQIATNGSGGTLYMYGPDGDKLFNVVRPVLEASNLTKGASVTVRYGPAKEGVKEHQIHLHS